MRRRDSLRSNPKDRWIYFASAPSVVEVAFELGRMHRTLEIESEKLKEIRSQLDSFQKEVEELCERTSEPST